MDAFTKSLLGNSNSEPPREDYTPPIFTIVFIIIGIISAITPFVVVPSLPPIIRTSGLIGTIIGSCITESLLCFGLAEMTNLIGRIEFNTRQRPPAATAGSSAAQ